MPAAPAPARRVLAPRGRYVTNPERLLLTGLTPAQRQQIVLLVREMRRSNGYATRKDALAALAVSR